MLQIIRNNLKLSAWIGYGLMMFMAIVIFYFAFSHTELKWYFKVGIAIVGAVGSFMYLYAIGKVMWQELQDAFDNFKGELKDTDIG